MWVRIIRILEDKIFMDSRAWLNRTTPAILSFNPFLLITRLHGLVLIKQHDDVAKPTLKRLLSPLRYRTYLISTGVLTCFPFTTNAVKQWFRID